jgi:preprotein translocase SecE subunit
MARDRKRAKQRQRRAQRAGVRPSQPRRENVPGPLDHASGEADEFDAALVAGADGEPVDAEAPDLADAATPSIAEEPLLDDEIVEEEELTGVVEDDEGELVPTGAAATPAERPVERREGSRVANFLRASWAELQRVQWPDRRQVGQATAVVLGFVVIAGSYLGLADVVFSRLVDVIL